MHPGMAQPRERRRCTRKRSSLPVDLPATGAALLQAAAALGGPARMAPAMAADAGWRRQPRVLVASVAMPSAAAATTCALSTNSSHVPGIAFVLISAIDFAEVAAKISRLTRRSNRKSRRLQ